ncbi:hypothetical protein [Flavobacterium limnosediminis]|nr:hypothetical protein [Flavobacterium limnosediminis]
MKNTITIILLFGLTALFGQNLKFDVMVKYSISRNGSNSERSIYGISTNSNYIMQILNNHDGSQTAHVYDLKSKEKYEFNVIEEKSNNKSGEFKFVHSNTISYSSYFPHPSQAKNVHFNFEKVSAENDIETVKLTFYKNKSKTKPYENFELKILNSDLNLFPLFRFTCLHPTEFITELNYVKPGLVTSAISENGLVKYILKSFEEASLELSLPN